MRTNSISLLHALALAGVIAALSLAPALASGFNYTGFNYTYVDGGYFSYSPSGGSSGSGPFFDGSYNFQSRNRYLAHMNIVAGFNHASYGGGVSGNDYALGLGGHFGVSSVRRLDVVLRALYLHDEISVSVPGGSLSASENGLGLAAGVRWMPLHRFEFDGLLEHDSFGCTGCSSPDILSVQGQYYFTPRFTGLVGIAVGDNNYGNLFRIGVRYYF
jgi:hypothetical protein